MRSKLAWPRTAEDGELKTRAAARVSTSSRTMQSGIWPSDLRSATVPCLSRTMSGSPPVSETVLRLRKAFRVGQEARDLPSGPWGPSPVTRGVARWLLPVCGGLFGGLRRSPVRHWLRAKPP